jgi:hypothetical protein
VRSTRQLHFRLSPWSWVAALVAWTSGSDGGSTPTRGGVGQPLEVVVGRQTARVPSASSLMQGAMPWPGSRERRGVGSPDILDRRSDTGDLLRLPAETADLVRERLEAGDVVLDRGGVVVAGEVLGGCSGQGAVELGAVGEGLPMGSRTRESWRVSTMPASSMTRTMRRLRVSSRRPQEYSQL